MWQVHSRNAEAWRWRNRNQDIKTSTWPSATARNPPDTLLFPLARYNANDQTRRASLPWLTLIVEHAFSAPLTIPNL